MRTSKNSNAARKLSGQAMDLLSLVDYQDGAVVSRTLIDKKTGTVTLFSFDTGQGISEHVALLMQFSM